MKKSLCFLSFVLVLVMALSMLPATAFAAETDDVATVATGNVAKVGNTEYATIDEAIANWTNGTTLTLLADVTLSKTIELSSTEYHILDLGTYTMTAASRKDAIQIVNNGRSSASYALDIKADATNPGGITATGKAVVKTTGKSGVKDRPIIRFYGGVFTGTNVVYHSGSNGTNCPQFWFYGGEFNGTVYANRALFQFYGGTFNGSLQISVDSSAYALISGGRFAKLSNLYGSSLNSDKFTIGSAKGNYNRGIYVDKDGYYVVTSEVITEVSAEYPAVKKESYNSNNYFYYSAAATYGMFYEVASMAGTGSNVTIWVKPAVTIPETVTGDAAVVEEIKNSTALKDYTPTNLPAGAELEIVLESVGETIVYDVTPMANGAEVEPTEAIIFRLPVPASVTKAYAKVYHEGTLMGIYEIKVEGDAKYVEVSSADFSEFAVEPITHYEVATYEELIAALANDGAYVVMTADITATATQSSGYGKAGIVVAAGDILDGSNHKLTINGAGATWDCAIAMRGGEVKNLTIAGAMRGVFMPGANGDVVIDNCVFENVIYTFNSDAGSKDYTVTIKNTTLNGWTSFSNAHKTVTFESCTFGKGSGYAFCRPYQATTFVDCDFEAGYEFDTAKVATTSTLEFKDCTYDGEALSADNKAMFYNGGSVVIDGVATDVTPPKGDASVGYVSTTTIWGECGGNAKESFIIKIYSGDTYLGYTQLNNIDGILDGDVWVTWHAMLIPEDETDSYWTTVWEVELTSDKAPTKIELWIDDVCVDTGAVQMNGPDNLNPVKWEELGGVKYICTGLKGAGTETDPYKISRVEELIFFRNSVNAGETKYNAAGMYFVLTADIDLAGENWVGIGSATADHGFMGNFDGNGKKIKNLTITNPAVDADGYAYSGLFSVTEGAANAENVIKNLIIENVTISTTGDIVAAAIAYPYYTTVDNVTVCGVINITGGNYTAGALAYTRRCVNASNVTVSGNTGSTITGKVTVGGVISDIQMNGGLTANYSNFAVSGVTITGEKCVGGISGIIGAQNLAGATVENVVLVCDNRVGTVSGALDGTVTISNVTVNNVTGPTAVIGAAYDSGKLVVSNGNVYTAVAPVASVDGVNYATLAEAINAATAGQTITFLADITENVTISKNLTIDGAGKTYIGKMTLKADTTIKNVNFDGKGYNGYAVETRGANYVTIEDCTAKNYGYGFLQLASGTVLTTVKNVTVSDMNYGVKVDYSNAVVLENVNMTANVAAVLNSNYGEKTITIKNSKLNILGTWTRNNTTKTTYVFEGNNAIDSFIIDAAIDTFKLAKDATLTAPETVVVTTDVEHAYVNYDNGKFVVKIYAAMIGDRYYKTLAEAIAEKAKKTASTKEDVILYSDIELNETLEIRGTKTIVINLNGHTVTSTAKKAFEIYAKTVTIKNGTIKAVQRCVDTREAVTLTLTDVTLIADEYSTHGNPQPLTIGGSTDGTRVTMTRVKISAKAGYGIITFVETNLTATNCTISGYNALYVKPGSEDSTFNFVGCTLSGSTLGNDVEGNSFSTIAVRAENVAVTVGKNSTVEAYGDYCAAISFGGNYAPEAGPMKGAKVTIAEGATIRGEVVAAAKLGNKYYATLADAIAERDKASSNDQIILMSNIVLEDTLTIEASKAIVLDLNGYTISQEKACTGHYAMIVNNSKSLTIKDSVGGGKISFKDTGAGDANFGWGSYTIENKGQLILMSGTIENVTELNTAAKNIHMYCAIQQNVATAHTQIRGGVVSTPTYRSIRINQGKLTINDGVIDGQVWIQPFAEGITVSINGGSFSPNGGDSSSIYVENSSKTVSFRVNGGSFEGKIGCANADALKGCIRGGEFTDAAYENTNAVLFHKTFVR